MTKKQKLELTWIGKENRPRLEPRILLEVPEKSYHAKQRVRDTDRFDNRLIFGDNLLALKALEQEFTGKIKCIFIDPPYNTGSAFEHYDDGIEHSLWLSMMRDRLDLLQKLLSIEGSIWVVVDDNEGHYLKVLMDEVFGRPAFVATVVWQSRYSRSNDASLSQSHNFIMVYAKDPDRWKTLRNRLERTESQAAQYKNPDNDKRGPWRAIPWDAPNLRPNLTYPIKTLSGKVRMPPPGRCWSRTEDQWLAMVESGLAYFGKSGDGAPSFKQFLSEASAIVPNTWWPHEDAGHTDEAKKEIMALFGQASAFATPKPERLVQRIIHIATNPGDLVLDSFGGSGTTGAVAQKMGRRWIMVELGEHCHTHIIPRLKKVVDGTDPGGITEAVGWKGGGGFRYYRLAPSLLEKDKWGQWVISKEFNAAMLAEAACKLEGFTYAPSDTLYWQHGHSTERDFIYVTTQHLSADQLAQLSDEVGQDRSLLVLCAAFRVSKSGTERYPNLTVKKIPKQVLSRCEWGHDDYSLKVENLPKAPPPPPKTDKRGQQALFDAEVGK
jgi:adenine-specific DNA-methyltransferase